MISKDKILKRLQEHLNAVYAAGYPEDRVLGIFLYGSQNYGMATDDSDVDSKVIYLPTFEEICFNKQWVSEEVPLDNNEHVEVKDIREMRLMWQKQNINFIELLYTEYFILNPKYEQLFNHYFINNRELIAHYDRAKAVKSIGNQALHTLKQDGTDNKKLYNARRLFYFLREYILGFPYEKCIKQEGSHYDLLRTLKYNCRWDTETRLRHAEELEKNLECLIEAHKNIDSPDQETAGAALDEGVCEILKLSFAEKTLSKKEFLNNLTNTETKALRSIYREIREEGNISLSKMVEQYSISRPVYQNLLNKLKEYNMAEVTAQGMKGTHIKFTHPEIKADAREA